jgi:hypothetical protein
MATGQPKRSFFMMMLSMMVSMLGSMPLPQSWKYALFVRITSALERRGR